MKPKNVVVATHGHCFDGLASAAVFTRLRTALEHDGATYRYRSCGYGPGMSAIPEAWLDGDDNAILDFRYTKSDRLGWYFDHHITGFGSNDERDRALERPRVFYDAQYGSCTKLIADVAKERLGVDLGDIDELVGWADKIDTARFASAEEAVRRDEPVLQLASVIEHHGDGPFLATWVPRLVERSLGDVARSVEVQALFAPIRASQEAFVERVRRAAKPGVRVVTVDLSDAVVDVAAKFVTYALFPRCVYSVTLTRGKQHYKLSVGYNPWSGVARDHDISAICKRYDGGGHPAVGACTFPLSAAEKARTAAKTVARELEG